MDSLKNTLVIVLVLAAFGGGGVLARGLQDRSLARQSADAPEEITLRDLIERGPNGNANVVIKDFALGEDTVYKGRSFAWQTVWVPAFPAGEAAGQGGRSEPRVLIKSARVRNAFDLARLGRKKKLRGLVLNRVEKLGDEEAKLLRQRYPGTDFSRCLVVEEGRGPARPSAFRGWLVFGACLLGASGLSLLGLVGLARVGAGRPVIRSDGPNGPRADTDQGGGMRERNGRRAGKGCPWGDEPVEYALPSPTRQEKP